MTRNQIYYWELQETKRSNLSREAETHRANVASENETYRHNTASETLTSLANQEQARHNRAVEAETNRANLANEQIKTATLTLDVAKLQEQNRSNLANESIARSNAETNARNASTSYAQVQETIRNNQNVLNQKTSQNMMQNQISIDQLAEQTRHNKATERATILSTAANFATQMQRNQYSAMTSVLSTNARLLGGSMK